MHVRVGRTLPAHLALLPGPHTLDRFLKNLHNPGSLAPVPEPTDGFEPRQNQYEAADAIAARAAVGGRMFLLADEPGVGKTISADGTYDQAPEPAPAPSQPPSQRDSQHRDTPG